MTALARDELWRQLSEAGLVEGELPAAPAAESRSPWPVRAMLGISGWIGALFLLGFIGVMFERVFRNAQDALPVGAICCLGAWFIFRVLPRNDFAGQFAFAVSLAGQALLLFGFSDLGNHRPSVGVFLSMAVVEAGLTLAIPHYVHRVFTTIAANFCLLLAAEMLGAPAIATVVAAVGVTVAWLDQARMSEWPALMKPLGYGFAIALIHLDGSLMIGPEFWRMLAANDGPEPRFLVQAGPVIAGLVFVFAVWRLRERAGVEPGSRAGVFTTAAAVILALCGLGAPGISAAILILVLGFANGNRVLMGLGLLAFAGYVSHFYYQLSSTLLVKSIVLTGTGAALLALRSSVVYFFPAAPDDAEMSHA